MQVNIKKYIPTVKKTSLIMKANEQRSKVFNFLDIYNNKNVVYAHFSVLKTPLREALRG